MSALSQTDMFSEEDGSRYAYKGSQDPSVRHELVTVERIK